METSQTVVRHKDALRRALGPEILGPPIDGNPYIRQKSTAK